MGWVPSLVVKLVGECGTDLRAWPSAKALHIVGSVWHRNKISRRQSSNQSERAIIQPCGGLATPGCGHPLDGSDTALGAF